MATLIATSTISSPIRSGPLLSSGDLASIRSAIQAEIAAATVAQKSSCLDIGAIENLADQPGNLVYRLVLSTPIQAAPDQAVTFPIQRPEDKNSAIVIKSDEEGLIVDCQKALAAEAKLLTMSFDPAFILVDLEWGGGHESASL